MDLWFHECLPRAPHLHVFRFLSGYGGKLEANGKRVDAATCSRMPEVCRRDKVDFLDIGPRERNFWSKEIVLHFHSTGCLQGKCFRHILSMMTTYNWLKCNEQNKNHLNTISCMNTNGTDDTILCSEWTKCLSMFLKWWRVLSVGSMLWLGPQFCLDCLCLTAGQNFWLHVQTPKCKNLTETHFSKLIKGFWNSTFAWLLLFWFSVSAYQEDFTKCHQIRDTNYALVK